MQFRRSLGAALCVVALLAPALATAQPAPSPLSLDESHVIALAMAAARRAGGDVDARTSDAPISDADAIAFARASRGLIDEPTRLDPFLALKPAYDARADFAAARQAGRLQAWGEQLVRRDPAFTALAKARDAYAVIVATGGWSPLPVGMILKPGATGPIVPSLRQRLAVEGYPAATPKSANLYDPALAQAIEAFQAHHGLTADGVLSAETLAALNVPAQARLDAIEANLERGRWLPNPLPADRIEVDTGEPQAALYHDGAPTLTMRAIVGRPDRRTPTFASRVVAIKFNPPWIVPAKIAAQEVLPKGRAYLARGGFYVSDGQVVQRPGPKAALGYVKFEIPDAFDVYMHDTPARTLFARDRRWLSHGCMRLENPRGLAAALLASQGWDRNAVDAAIASGKTRSVPVRTQIPVFVVYRTAVPGGDGHITFRPDTYGWDAKIATALRSVAG